MTLQSRTGRRLSQPGFALVSVLGALVLAGCDFDYVPIKAREGPTVVHAAVIRQGGPNAGIITTSQGVVVIDPPLSPDVGKALRAEALRKSNEFWDEKHRASGFVKRTQAPPVLYVLNTTFRATHCFGNQVFFHTADLITSDRAGRRIANLQDGLRMKEQLAAQYKIPGLDDWAMVPPTMTVKEGGELTLRTDEAEIRFVAIGDCAGEGDAVVYLPRHKVLFAGDLAVPGFVPYARGRTPTVRNWIAALKKLEDLDLETVVPGHGPVGKKDLLKQQREFLQALVDAVQRAIAAGKSEEQAAKEVLVDGYAQWRNYREWLPDNVRLVYQELKSGEAPRAEKAVPPPDLATPGKVEPRDIFHDR